MENDFDKVMSARSDAELIKILNGKPDDYQPAAFAGARREFERRDLSEEKVAVAKQEIKKNRELKKKPTCRLTFSENHCIYFPRDTADFVCRHL